MCYSILIKALTFARSGIHVNPSRAAPHTVKPAPSSDNQRSIYTVLGNTTTNYQYAVFTSVLAVTTSNLHLDEPQSLFRQLAGTMCTQEWERFCAFFCMVYREQELNAQIYEDAISISTRAKPKTGNAAGTRCLALCIHC